MKKKKTWRKVGFYICFILLLCVFLYPFYLVVLNSLKTNKEVILDALALPQGLNFEGYTKAFERMNYFQSFANSLIVTVGSIVLIVLISAMCAHLFARKNWKINKIIFMIMVASMIIPFQTIMIPVVKNFSALNLTDNLFAVMVFYMGAHVSMAVFMYHGFIKNIPFELEEAATIDGCGQMGILFKVVFPMLKPITSTIVIMDVLAIWNDFLLPYILLYKDSLKTLPLMTFSFVGQYSTDYSLVTSALVLTMIPVIILYLLLQKQIIEGVSQGAIK
ncbi:MAG TPA: carbohydrate ABC transporter permease [Candidatus Limivivens merdigallinarum]|uniref:Carbohydrate ABC transporter permease n=1 Tax=Candidatus Limivivens merdigallinarum TaxID=2840859 RepID=A0A9D1CZR8_9FIRM|nr:carbohydrate ABC transporter permease [Candidatus Limivivens merdigallinarum]